jgi:hypothetical protein
MGGAYLTLLNTIANMGISLLHHLVCPFSLGTCASCCCALVGGAYLTLLNASANMGMHCYDIKK